MKKWAPFAATFFIFLWIASFLIYPGGLESQTSQTLSGNWLLAKSVAPKSDRLSMKKFVTAQANFVLYLPEGWSAKEGTQSGYRTLFVTDAQNLYEASLFYGISPEGNNVTALAKTFVSGIGRQFPDLQLGNVLVSPDKSRITFEGTFTLPQKGKREFRTWVSVSGGSFIYSGIEAPEGKLAEVRQSLLTILANVRILKGSFSEGGPPKVSFAPRRLKDGSASFQAPHDWAIQDFGKTSFVAQAPNGSYSFIAANVGVVDPRLQVKVPGATVSPYLPPHRAMQFLTSQQRLASDMRFLEVIPRQDLAQQMGRVYTAGPVTTEEFVYTFTAQGRPNKGYTFGTSFGSRLGTNWNFWHITVAALTEFFDPFVPHFVTMIQSYKIDDQYAAHYISQGIARLRQLQQQTSQMVTRNAQEIRQMMQAAYDERQKSMEYIDYQRSNYIRGQQDWISTVEGGTLYHTDSWGTKNTATGEYWEGQPYNYVNFKGDNPKYREQMAPIDRRELWERHIQK